MARRDVSYLKPPRFKDHLTLAELSEKVGRDASWLRVLERDARIPRATRVRRGQIDVRLWSPAQVREIEQIISQHRPGRPKNG
jgi:hypothetical protein